MSINRSSGILLPVSSLPSNYGIGTLGIEAYKFVDFLVSAKQTYWQMLPLGPTSYGDSPYSSFSSFAGNPYFIDLDKLIQEKLLTKADVKDLKNPQYIDYGDIYYTRFDVLRKAYEKGKKVYAEEFAEFVKKNDSWLEDYAFYMAVKKHFKMVSWLDWPDASIRTRTKAGIEKYRKLVSDDVDFYKFLQFLFYRQFNALKEYAHAKGIKLIGDLPIYVAMDSSDVWAHTECFQLDDQYVPTSVAGVPPDYFSADGQLWGNPLYDWDYLKKTGYKFWIDRVDGVSKLFDVVRIDHFRGFASYWAVPYGEKTAKKGEWRVGPGPEFVAVLTNWFSNVDFIAEDLGTWTEDVGVLMKACGLPGMKVLEFGFTHNGISDHTPFTYTKDNYICYSGTHDNSTIMGWKKLADPKDVEYIYEYANMRKEDDFAEGMIREGMKSVAKVFIAQLQDYLSLDDAARINVPGTVGENWKWRLQGKECNGKLAKRIAYLTALYGRER